LLAVTAVAIAGVVVARGTGSTPEAGGAPSATSPVAAGAPGESELPAASAVLVPDATFTSPHAAACAGQDIPLRRCDAIVDDAMDRAGLQPAEVASVEFLPFERVMTLGGGQVALVRFRLVGGTTVDQDVQCVGVSFRPACNDVAEIIAQGGVDHDVPCMGEPPAGCATMPPTPGPDAVGAATPFRLASIDIPLDHRGTYEVRLGTATLPDGYLSERSFRLADPRPTSYWINAPVFMDVRSDIAGRPFVGSVYRDPFDGPEPVTIFLVFAVDHLEAPSVLQVRDIVVR
jgi:hypothetical protein